MVIETPVLFVMPGGPEMIVILAIVVLLFGANKLPALARSSGQAIGEFQKGRDEIEEELHSMTAVESTPESATAHAGASGDTDSRDSEHTNDSQSREQEKNRAKHEQ